MGKLSNIFNTAAGVGVRRRQKKERIRLEKARKTLKRARNIREDVKKSDSNITFKPGTRPHRTLSEAEAITERARRRAKKGKRF